MPTPHPDTDLVVVAPPDAAPGFRLAGARTIDASDATAAADAVAELVASGRAALVAVHAGLWAGVPAGVREEWGRRSVPLVLPVLDEDADAGALRDEALRDLLSRAVGYQITFEPTGEQA